MSVGVLDSCLTETVILVRASSRQPVLGVTSRAEAEIRLPAKGTFKLAALLVAGRRRLAAF